MQRLTLRTGSLNPTRSGFSKTQPQRVGRPPATRLAQALRAPIPWWSRSITCTPKGVPSQRRSDVAPGALDHCRVPAPEQRGTGRRLDILPPVERQERPIPGPSSKLVELVHLHLQLPISLYGLSSGPLHPPEVGATTATRHAYPARQLRPSEQREVRRDSSIFLIIN